jgi:BlaI family penicillinase repressor
MAGAAPARVGKSRGQVDFHDYMCNYYRTFTDVIVMRISEAESIVMEALWRREGAQSAEDIVAATAAAQGWQEATVKTLLNRLLKKRAIAAERDGRRYLYRALLKRADYVHVESKSLLDRLYGGRIAPLVAHFSERSKLSRKDIAEIRALIEEIERGR